MLEPDSLPNLLFMKLPRRSPICVPNDCKMPIMSMYGMNIASNAATIIPLAIPEIKPLIVLWGPKMGLPLNFLPKSKGLPPPNITGAPLATYAGSM